LEDSQDDANGLFLIRNLQSAIRNKENARVTTADAEQTAVAAFLPSRGS
jgi:hypothetical protein